MDDPARIRYTRTIPAPDDSEGWVVLPVVELPPPDDEDEGWPLDELDRYIDMVAERFGKEKTVIDLLTHCLFRTAEDLEDPAHQMGRRVPAV